MKPFTDPIWVRIAKLGFPSLGSVLLPPIYAATDSAIMGHVGKILLAALALAMGFLNFWVLPLTSVGFAITSRAASLKGAGDLRAQNNLGISASLAMGIFGLLLGLIFTALAPVVSQVLTHSPAVAISTQQYLQLASIGMPALFIIEAGAMFLTGVGRTSIVLAITTLNVGSNIVLELIFVFGAHMSVAGSAIGTDIAEIIGAGTILWVLRYRGALENITSRVLAFVREFMSAGSALTARTFALMGALSGTVFLASQGTPEILDSFQIGQQIWLVFGLSFDAVAVPAQVLVGEWLATGQLKHMTRWTSRLLHIGWIGAIGLTVVMVLARGAIVGLFTDIPSIIGPARKSVEFAGIAMPVTAVSFVIDGLVGGFEGFAILRTIMFISLLAAGTAALILVLIVGRHLDIIDIWLIFGIWLLTRAVASLLAWKKLLITA